jgi:hypothetical protein
LTYADSNTEVHLQAADLYCSVWNRNLNRAINSELLEQAKEGIEKKRKWITVTGERQFREILNSLDRDFWAGAAAKAGGAAKL